jgi:SHS2 domain-containing protein
MPYEFFPHTGDIGIRLRGETLEALMQSALEAFTDAVVDRSTVRDVDAGAVSCRAPAPDLLLHEFLSEVLYQFDARGRLSAGADVTITREAGDWVLDARTSGEQIDAARHQPRVIVKGVTYHALSAAETAEGWEGTVILDI